MESEEEIAEHLRQLALDGRPLIDLIDWIKGISPYSRGAVVLPFRMAFGLSVKDLQSIILGCSIFGDGAIGTVEEAEHAFRQRLPELGVL